MNIVYQIYNKNTILNPCCVSFSKLYNQQTSVDCTFGDLKDKYILDNIQIAKMARTKVYMDLSCIALIASRRSDVASKEKSNVA